MATAIVKKQASKPKAKTGGRALILLDEVKRDELINLIVLGLPINKAVAMVNIAESTFYNWMSRGMVERDRLATIPDAKPKPEEKIYLEFLESLTRAREAIAKKVAVISSAASQGDWKASAWWLERQVPEDFGRIDKQEVLSHSVSEVRVTVTMGELQEKIAKVLESRKTKSA